MATTKIRDYSDLMVLYSKRLNAAAKRKGRLTWREAHYAMHAGYPDRRDGALDNRRILQMIERGWLAQEFDDKGYSFILAGTPGDSWSDD